MPKFTTVSPTHIEGKKQYAWERFCQGGYVAIGWLQHVDLTGKSIDEIIDIIRSSQHDNETRPIEAFKRFLSLDRGDYVAVNNTNHGLFGVGVIESEYKFQPLKHDTGAEDHEQFYSHYRMVKWLNTAYTPRTALVSEGETGWQPFGTVGKVYAELPPYIARVLRLPPIEEPITIIRPAFLESVFKTIETLQSQHAHAERAHESLVEEFFVALGYRKHEDIKYRQGRVDIALKKGGHTILVVEVKPGWDLSRYNGTSAVKQAYGYAHDQGVRYIIVTNGDIYILYDRLKGLSWDSNLLGEFRLTALQEEDLALVDRLRPQRLANPDMAEAFRHIAESFTSDG